MDESVFDFQDEIQQKQNQFISQNLLLNFKKQDNNTSQYDFKESQIDNQLKWAHESDYQNPLNQLIKDFGSMEQSVDTTGLIELKQTLSLKDEQEKECKQINRRFTTDFNGKFSISGDNFVSKTYVEKIKNSDVQGLISSNSNTQEEDFLIKSIFNLKNFLISQVLKNNMSENIVDDDNQIDYSSLNKGFVQSSIGRQNDQITKVTDIKLSKLNINDLLTQSCMMDSIITQNNNITKTSDQKNPNKLIGDQIFESFMMVGCDKQEIIEFEKENSNLYLEVQQGILTPKIISCFNNNQNDINNNIINQSLQNFIFPFGVNIQKYNIKDSLTEISQILYLNSPRNGERSFSFSVQSEQTFQKDKCQLNSLIQKKIIQKFIKCLQIFQQFIIKNKQINPECLLYCYNIQMTDFFETTSDDNQFQKINRKKRKFWLIPINYTVASYYPFGNFFYDIIVDVIDQIKFNRISEMTESNTFDVDQKYLTKLDAVKTKEIFNLKVNEYLQNLLKIQIPNFNETIEAQGLIHKLNYQVPSQDMIYFEPIKQAAPITFSSINYEDLIFIFICLWFEKKVCLFSKNLNLVSSSIMTFQALMEPFKWAYPICCIIPESFLSILDSPVPIFIGLSQDLTFFQNRNLQEQFTDTVFYSLDHEILFLKEDKIKEIKNSMPSFNKFQDSFQNIYQTINKKKSYNFSSSKRISQLKLSEKYELTKSTITQQKPIVIQNPTLEINSISIIQFIKNKFHKFIIDLIPKDYISTEQALHLFQQNIIKSKSDAKDVQFFNKIMQNMGFLMYIEEKLNLNSI